MGNGNPFRPSSHTTLRHSGYYRPYPCRVFMKFIFPAMLFPFVAASGFAASQSTIIPLPQKIETQDDGVFVLQPKTRILVEADPSAGAMASANYLAERLRKSSGYALEVSTASKPHGKGAILLTSRGVSMPSSPEGYGLSGAADSVVIRAHESAGLFYGAQSLLQLLPPEVFASKPMRIVAWTVPPRSEERRVGKECRS